MGKQVYRLGKRQGDWGRLVGERPWWVNVPGGCTSLVGEHPWWVNVQRVPYMLSSSLSLHVVVLTQARNIHGLNL